MSKNVNKNPEITKKMLKKFAKNKKSKNKNRPETLFDPHNMRQFSTLDPPANCVSL